MNTKDMILESVKRLLNEKSLKDVRVQDICEVCGVSKGTFYAHFRDKYDAANSYYMQELLVKGIINNLACGHAERLLRQVKFFRDNATVFLHLMQENGQNSFLDFLYKETYDIYLSELMEQFDFRPSLETDYMIHGIMAAQIDCLHRWLKEGCPFDDTYMRDMLLHLEKSLLSYTISLKGS